MFFVTVLLFAFSGFFRSDQFLIKIVSVFEIRSVIDQIPFGSLSFRGDSFGGKLTVLTLTLYISASFWVLILWSKLLINSVSMVILCCSSCLELGLICACWGLLKKCVWKRCQLMSSLQWKQAFTVCKHCHLHFFSEGTQVLFYYRLRPHFFLTFLFL